LRRMNRNNSWLPDRRAQDRMSGSRSLFRSGTIRNGWLAACQQLPGKPAVTLWSLTTDPTDDTPEVASALGRRCSIFPDSGFRNCGIRRQCV
jgi:hypothetical protein